MIELLGNLISYLPFEWASYTFMQYALLGMLLLSPMLALLGTLVVDHRLTFFSDSLGHVTLTGVALSVLLGASASLPSMVIFSLLFTYFIFFLKKITRLKVDSVISMMTSFCVALGIAIISAKGTLSKFNSILFGNVLALTENELQLVLILLLIFLPVFYLLHRGFILIQLSKSLAKSRGAPIFLIEFVMLSLLAVVVTFAVSWVGLLVMNALLVLPVVTSKLLAKSLNSFLLYTLFFGIFTSLAGLLTSFYINSSTGATIVLGQMILFISILISKKFMAR